MTIKGGSRAACASCKFQRRRCLPDCALAPYFPADRHDSFRNAHRLFGNRNMLKTLESLREDQRPDAMKSIIFESNARAQYPVHGCYGIVQHLLSQCNQASEELQLLKFQIEACKIDQRRRRRRNGVNCSIPSDDHHCAADVPLPPDSTDDFPSLNKNLIVGGSLSLPFQRDLLPSIPREDFENFDDLLLQLEAAPSLSITKSDEQYKPPICMQ